jgi:hypothetical protein
MGMSDQELLDALDRACALEVGGWAPSGAVAAVAGESAASMGNRFHRLAREGRIEAWSPKASRHYRLTLFRRAR